MAQSAEMNNALEELVQEGFRSYPNTLLALKVFRAKIQSRSRNVLEGKLNELSMAMGDIKLDKDNILDYTAPDRISGDYDGDWAWVAVKIPTPVPYLAFYFGLTFTRKEKSDTICQATAMLETKDNKSATLLINRGKDTGTKFYVDWGKQVCVSKTFNPNGPDIFETKLEEVINIWIDFWHKTGGINTLLK